MFACIWTHESVPPKEQFENPELLGDRLLNRKGNLANFLRGVQEKRPENASPNWKPKFIRGLFIKPGEPDQPNVEGLMDLFKQHHNKSKDVEVTGALHNPICHMHDREGKAFEKSLILDYYLPYYNLLVLFLGNELYDYDAVVKNEVFKEFTLDKDGGDLRAVHATITDRHTKKTSKNLTLWMKRSIIHALLTKKHMRLVFALRGLSAIFAAQNNNLISQKMLHVAAQMFNQIRSSFDASKEASNPLARLARMYFAVDLFAIALGYMVFTLLADGDNNNTFMFPSNFAEVAETFKSSLSEPSHKAMFGYFNEKARGANPPITNTIICNVYPAPTKYHYCRSGLLFSYTEQKDEEGNLIRLPFPLGDESISRNEPRIKDTLLIGEILSALKSQNPREFLRVLMGVAYAYREPVPQGEARATAQGEAPEDTEA